MGSDRTVSRREDLGFPALNDDRQRKPVLALIAAKTVW
jgi:hypothetical protein